MKLVKKLSLLMLVAGPYFMALQSQAGDKEKKDKKNTPAASTNNSVPLDGGVVFLMVAGLGLGAKLLYDARAKKVAGRL